MKEPQNWDEDYILDSLPKGEIDQIEFKGRKEIDLTTPGITNVNQDGLGKALSALANSGGGFLILGINDKTRTIDDGGINKTIKSNGTRAWLEDFLPVLVDPALVKLNVFEIEAGSPSSNIQTNRAIYVVEVGDSPLAPHQSVSDHIYYGRVGGKSRPLGNRMVLDILNRRKYPDLEVEFFYAHVNDSNVNVVKRQGIHNVLLILIKNNGPVYAQYADSIIFLRDYLIEPGVEQIFNIYPVTLADGLGYIRFVRENTIQETLFPDGTIATRGPGRYVPILPGRVHQWTIPLVEDFTTKQMHFKAGSPKLYWELYADNAPCKKGEIPMKQIPLIPENFIGI